MATKKMILRELEALQKNLEKACNRAERISQKIDIPSFAELFFLKTQLDSLIELILEGLKSENERS